MRVSPSAGDERGVSPLVGVILLIAISVALGTVVGGFGIGLAEQTTREIPSVRLSISFDADAVTVTHQSGDVIQNGGNVEVVATGGSLQGSGWADGTTVSAGSSVRFTVASGWSGGQVEVRWSDGETTVILAKKEVPE